MGGRVCRQNLAISAGLLNEVQDSDGITYEPATRDEHESMRDKNDPKQWDGYNALHGMASTIVDDARTVHKQYAESGIATDGLFRGSIASGRTGSVYAGRRH